MRDLRYQLLYFCHILVLKAMVYQIEKPVVFFLLAMEDLKIIQRDACKQ